MTEKTRTHGFLDKHTIIGCLILAVGGMLLSQVLTLFNPLFGLSEDAEQFIGGIEVAVMACLILALYKRWFSPEYDGSASRVDAKTVCMLVLPFIIYWLADLPISYIGGERFSAVTMGMVGAAITAGFGEEMAFRALSGSYLMRQWSGESSVIKTVWTTAIVFGAIHSLNLAAGADAGHTLVQVVGALALGIFFMAVFLRTGNIWITIVLHTIHDILAFSLMSEFDSGIIKEGVTSFTLIGTLLDICIGAVGLYMVRKSKRAEIRALWDEKWSKA